MVVVDASVWVAMYLPGDINHRLCAAWIISALRARTPLYAPTVLLPEIAGPVARVSGESSKAQAALEEILKLRSLTLVPPEGAAAARIAADLKLRGMDAVYVEIADRLNMPLVTLDTRLMTSAGDYIVIRRPET